MFAISIEYCKLQYEELVLKNTKNIRSTQCKIDRVDATVVDLIVNILI